MNSAQMHVDVRAIEVAAEARQMAKDARDQCRAEYEGLWADLRQHREETNRRFDRQDQERTRMHGENQERFDKLFRALYTAVGIGTAVTAGMAVVAPYFLPRLFH